MKKLAIVVEGQGDEKALPPLIAHTGISFGYQVVASRVVRAGGWMRLRRPGEIERYCRLAGTHSDVDAVLVVSDRDDHCAKQEYHSTLSRIKSISDAIGIPIRLCFCVREFETWLLEGFEQIKSESPEVAWVGEPPPSPTKIRGAKEAFKKLLGSNYRETIDQEKFSRRIDPVSLYKISRSFRKFVQSVCDADYLTLETKV